jgi:hypothetical protein
LISEQAREAYAAIKSGDLSRVRDLVAADPDVVGLNSPSPLLTVPVETGDVRMLELLLDLGCDPNNGGKFLSTPLLDALSKRKPQIARLLLERGADPNLGRTAITAVVGEKLHSVELLQLLDEFGADLGRNHPLGNSDVQVNALSMAIQWGNQAAVDFLKEKGVRMPDEDVSAVVEESDPDEVVGYFRQHFGPVKQQAIVEIVPTTPQIAIHVVPPGRGRNHTTLFTNGMSKRGMNVPRGRDTDYSFAELFIEVPGEFPTSFEEMERPEVGWPILWLRSLASYPSREDTWLGGPIAIVSNGDPPSPLAPGFPFTAMLLLAEKSFTTKSGRLIQLYRLTPLFLEEVELEKREGMSALMRAFDRFSVPFIVNPERLNVGKKSGW